MNKYSDDPIENELFERTHRLMEEKWQAIRNGEKNLYSLAVHELIKDSYAYGVGHIRRRIIMPMSKEKIEKSSMRLELKEYYSRLRNCSWPKDSFYQYGYHLCNDESPDFLNFGYAVCGEELFPCAFFMNFLMTWKIPECPGQLFPDEYAVDYMGLNSGKNPECYIGITLHSSTTEEWILSRGKTIFPLEYLVQAHDKELEENSEWEREILMGQHEMIKDLSDDNRDLAIKWLMKN